MPDIKTTVAKAIREADTSYFSEDYEKQARAVLKAIDQAGFVLLPKETPEGTAATVANLIPTGRMKPEDLVKQIYSITISQLRMKA